MKNRIKNRIILALVFGMIVVSMKESMVGSTSAAEKTVSEGELRIAATATPSASAKATATASASAKPTATPRPTVNPYASSFYISRYQATDASSYRKYDSAYNWVGKTMYLNFHTVYSEDDLSEYDFVVELQVYDSTGDIYDLGPNSTNVRITRSYQSIPINLISPKADREYFVTINTTMDGYTTEDSGKIAEFRLYKPLSVQLNQSSEVSGKSGESIPLTVSVSGGTGSSTYNYQWYTVSDSSTKQIQGATEQTYQARVDGKKIYMCEVSDEIDTVSTQQVTVLQMSTIRYELGYEAEDPESETKNYGEPFMITFQPEREGYDFEYWKGSDGRIYRGGDRYTTEKDLTLLANWTSKKKISAKLKDNKRNRIVYGKTARIEIKNRNGRAVRLESSDSNVLATIGSDLIKAVGFGSADITVVVPKSEGYKEERYVIKDIKVLPPEVKGFKLLKKDKTNYIYTWKDTVGSLRKKSRTNAKKYKLRYIYIIMKTGDKGKDSLVRLYENQAYIPLGYKGNTMKIYMYYKCKGETMEGKVKKIQIGK